MQSSHHAFFSYLCSKKSLAIPEDFYSLASRDFLQSNGITLLTRYYEGSVEKFILSNYPHIAWIEWRFKGTKKWINPENHKRFFAFMEEGLKIKKREDWYDKLSKAVVKEWGGASLLLMYHNDSPFKFLRAMIPDHVWLPWKFKFTPNGFWGSQYVHRSFFHWCCHEMRIQCPEGCYSMTQKEINARGGSWLLKFYRCSPELFVRNMVPEIKWITWWFRGNKKWEKVEDHLKYFKWIGEELGFKTKEAWMKLTLFDVQRLNGGVLIREYYGNSVRLFVKTFLGMEEKVAKKDLQMRMMDVVFFLLPKHTPIK